MGKRLFSGDMSPLPDNLRCRRSDGRQWRCPQPAKSGLSFCEYHYQQVRRNQDNIKNTNAAPEPERRLLLPADPPLSKKRRRKRMRKDPPPISSEKMEEGDLKVNIDLPSPDQKSDGREWQCSQTAMPILNFCVRRHLRCKQPKEEEIKVIEPKPKRSPRLAADLMPSIRRRRRRRRLKGEIRAEEPIKMECDVEPAVTSGLPIPDTLRCRRSDGRKWRCMQPAVPGLSFCEYHQMRCKQTYSKNARVKVTANEKDLLCCKEDSNKNEEEVEATESSTPEEMEAVDDQLRCKEDDNCRLQLAGDPQASMKDFSLQDHLRCRRSDGRKWRCPQLAMPSVGFCEYHYLQVRRNQGKRKNSKLGSAAKRKRGLRLVANQSMARKLRRRQGLKGEKLAGEERSRTAQKEERDEGMEAANLEVTRDLPNGVMAISPAPATGQANASPWLNWKIGSDAGYLFGRRFRSKNAELVPLGKVQKLPFSRSVVGRRKKACHRCRARENKVERRIRCLNCQQFFCATCIETWHSELSELEIKMYCPVCRGCCTCISCNSRRDEDGGSKKLVIHQNKFSATRYDHHLICDLIPLVKHINGEQITELEIEANNQGEKLLDASVKVAKYSDNDQVICNNCKTKINDFYRNCSTCTYRFCLSCCQKIRAGSLTKGDGAAVCEYSKRRRAYYRVDKAFNGKKVGLSSRKHVNVSALCTSVLPEWTTNKDSSISCPPKELGGCGVGVLNINFAIMSGSAKFISE